MITAALVSRGLCMLQQEQQVLWQVERRARTQPAKAPVSAGRMCAMARDGLRIRAGEGAALLMMLTAANDAPSVPAKA